MQKTNNISVRTSAPPDLHRPSGKRAERVGAVIALLLTIGLAVVLGRVVQLKFAPSPQLAERMGLHNSKRNLVGRRGTLTDRHGRALAVTHIVPRLFVDPFLIEDPNTFSETVGYTLGYNPAWIERKIAKRPNSRYIVLDDQLNDDRYHKFLEMDLDGLSVEPNLVREYPLGDNAGQVIGFVGHDGLGLEGLERTLDRALLPTGGKLSYLRDAARRPLWATTSNYQPPMDGHTIALSIDAMLQFFAQQQLEETCKEYDAQAGQIVVMQPHTGEILAMANYPPFDPNQFQKSDEKQRRNRCVTDVFEPGSTFKPFVWAAAVELGVAHPDEIFDCTDTGEYITSFGRRLHDASHKYGHGYGRITFDEVLVKSSNIGMAYAGERLGATDLHRCVSAFGFGRSTSSELPGEVAGILRPASKWTKYTVTSVPMGQEVAVTTLQLARAFCTFANDGLLVHPTIIARNPGDPRDSAPVVERLISKTTAQYTRQVLRRVITEGTGRRSNINTYTVFGKTGTAQVPDTVKGGYMPDEYTSVFVGGAPADEPQIVVATVIHRPDKDKGYYGGVVAGPAASKLIEKSLNYLGVQPVNIPSVSPDLPVALADVED